MAVVCDEKTSFVLNIAGHINVVLEYRVTQRGENSVLVTLAGELRGGPWTDQLRHFLDEHFIDDGVARLTIDLSSLDDIDLEGIATLLVLKAEAAHNRKQLWIQHARPSVRRKIRLRGVLSYLEEPVDER